jgi:hypothetical protein
MPVTNVVTIDSIDSGKKECTYWENSIRKFLEGLNIDIETRDLLIKSYTMNPQFFNEERTKLELSTGIQDAIISLAMLREITEFLSSESFASIENTETDDLLFKMFYAGFHVGRTFLNFKSDSLTSTVQDLLPHAKRGFNFNRSGKGKSPLRLRLEKILSEHTSKPPTWNSLLTILKGEEHKDVVLVVDRQQELISLKDSSTVTFKNFRNMITEAKKSLKNG